MRESGGQALRLPFFGRKRLFLGMGYSRSFGHSVTGLQSDGSSSWLYRKQMLDLDGVRGRADIKASALVPNETGHLHISIPDTSESQTPEDEENNLIYKARKNALAVWTALTKTKPDALLPKGSGYVELQRMPSDEKYAFQWKSNEGNVAHATWLSSRELAVAISTAKKKIMTDVKLQDGRTHVLDFQGEKSAVRLVDTKVESDAAKNFKMQRGSGVTSLLNYSTAWGRHITIQPKLKQTVSSLGSFELTLDPDGSHSAVYLPLKHVKKIQVSLAELQKSAGVRKQSIPSVAMEFGTTEAASWNVLVDNSCNCSVQHSFSDSGTSISGTIRAEAGADKSSAVALSIKRGVPWGSLAAKASTGGDASISVDVSAPKTFESKFTFAFSSSRTQSTPSASVRGAFSMA